MIRALWFLALVSAGIFALVWLADRPGSLVLEWQGYRVETSVAMLIGAIIAVSVATALSYRVWLFLRRAPSQLSGAWKQRRKQQGYQALTRGMVAVAAGDADEARRSVKRAEVLLNEPPLTMLLSAQTAQLNGDEKAAETFFKAMTENPETEFLGIRGLLGQAVKKGDRTDALALARRAYRLRPKSEWVANHLFDLQTREGLWLDARVTADEQVRNHTISKTDSKHRNAALYYQLGLEAKSTGDETGALAQFKKSTDNDPAFTPGVSLHALALIRKGRLRKAATLIEKAWLQAPHPDLLGIYWQASEANDGLEQVRATERLCKASPDHMESRVAKTRASLGAQLWGEARQQLEILGGENTESLDSRICRLWAELEEGEHNDLAKAHAWLTRASIADSEATWACGDCGNTVSEWMVNCGNCDGFNTFAWRRPLRVAGIGAPTTSQNHAPLVNKAPAVVEAGSMPSIPLTTVNS